MGDTDQEDVAKLLAALHPLDGWLQRMDPDQHEHGSVIARSPLSADDKATDPYQVSHGAWNMLGHAIDHLHCLRTLIRDAQVIHMYAPYTLARAALENAATAVWLLSPRTRNERVLRRLRLAVSDVRNSDKVQTVMGTAPRRRLEDRLNQIYRLAGARGIGESDVKSRPGWEEIVSAAGSAVGLGTAPAVAVWKACSGMAHGDWWATISITERTELSSTANITHERIEASTEVLRYAIEMSVSMAKSGWRLYDLRRKSPIESR